MDRLFTFQEVWVALERMFASHSSTRAILTRQFIVSTKKRNVSISAYFQKIKSFLDNLAASGQPLQNHEFTAYLLYSLDSSYDVIITLISTEIDKMSSELCSIIFSPLSYGLNINKLLLTPRLAR